MAKKKQPTPGEWRAVGAMVQQFNGEFDGLYVADCSMTDEGEANAQFIADAVARIDELEEHLDWALTAVNVGQLHQVGVEKFNRARKALVAMREWLPPASKPKAP